MKKKILEGKKQHLRTKFEMCLLDNGGWGIKPKRNLNCDHIERTPFKTFILKRKSGCFLTMDMQTPAPPQK